MGPIERGEVFRAALPSGRGHQTAGNHYVVVVSDEPYNWLSTVVVVPLSTGAQASQMHPLLTFIGSRAHAPVEQVTALDKRYLRELVGYLEGLDMDRIDERLRYLPALD